MKVVILAGGKGTRLAEETSSIPKPMVKIGSQPIILHIVNIYRKYGFNDFYIAGGYKYKIIEKFFKNRKINLKVIDTGKETQTGGRLLKLKKFLKEGSFLLTYGDGLSSVNIKKLVNFHNKNKKKVTMTVVRPPGRWGFVKIVGKTVKIFQEKNKNNEGWINGGFMVINSVIFKKYKLKNNTIFEKEILPNLAKNKQLAAFKHYGFWQCMDNLREKILLNQLSKKNAPWK